MYAPGHRIPQLARLVPGNRCRPLCAHRGPSRPPRRRSNSGCSARRVCRERGARAEAAQRYCDECHVIERNGPAGWTSAPSFAAIADKPTTTAASLRAFIQKPHMDMLNLARSPPEAADLAAYILSLRKNTAARRRFIEVNSVLVVLMTPRVSLLRRFAPRNDRRTLPLRIPHRLREHDELRLAQP